jgi:hypothetical protein
MNLGNYAGLFNITSVQSINKAIILMIYETFMVFVVLWISLCKNYKEKLKRTVGIKKINIIYNIIFLLFVFCLISYVIMPEIRMNFSSIFKSNNAISNNYAITSAIINRGLLKRALFTLTLLLIPILQICLPIVLFIKIRKYFGEKKLAVVLSLGCISLNFLMISGNNIDIFVISLVLSLILIRIYPKYLGFIIKVVGTFGFLGIVVIVIAKSNTDMFSEINPFVAQSKMFQGYFQGVSNVAGGFYINNPNKFSTLFYDFFDMIPFRNTLFNINGDRLVKVYCRSNNVVAQIIPCIIQSYHYLGFAFAPIVPMILAYWSTKTHKKSVIEKNVFKYAVYLLLLIYLAFSMAVNNFTIFGTMFFNVILPLYLISVFSGKASWFESISTNNIVNNR